jgi:hypothetical protein
VKIVGRALILLLVLAAGGCGSWPRMARVRFTVEIDDNGRPVSGSAVQEVDCAFNDGLIRMGAAALSCGVKGEALVVDLGAKGLLFVLLTADPGRRHLSGSPWGIFEYANRDLYDPVGLTAAAFDRIASQRTAVAVDAAHTPMMVRFRDVNDPTTIELVDPEHLDASFGGRVRFSKATVAITTDAITTGIEKSTPWLVGGNPTRWIVPPTGRLLRDIPFERRLTDSDFWDHSQ